MSKKPEQGRRPLVKVVKDELPDMFGGKKKEHQHSEPICVRCQNPAHHFNHRLKTQWCTSCYFNLHIVDPDPDDYDDPVDDGCDECGKQDEELFMYEGFTICREPKEHSSILFLCQRCFDWRCEDDVKFAKEHPEERPEHPYKSLTAARSFLGGEGGSRPWRCGDCVRRVGEVVKLSGMFWEQDPIVCVRCYNRWYKHGGEVVVRLSPWYGRVEPRFPNFCYTRVTGGL